MIAFKMEVLLLMPLFAQLMAFVPTTSRQNHHYVKTFSSIRNDAGQNSGLENDDSNDDEDDDTGLVPYGNRSLAWTTRYLKLIPYENARARAMGLGLRSKEEWFDHLEDGAYSAYLVSRPDEMYRDDWVSWEEFLGITRTYEEARDIVQNVLQLQSMREYEIFVKMDTARAAYLRLPAKPEIVYRESGWKGPSEFFGNFE